MAEIEAQKWDVIIVGSGLGGMTSGALLAKAGKRVLILERHYVPGGFTHTFKRKGFEWDVGVHYVGQVQDPKSILRKIFDYVSDGKLQWAPMGSVYDSAIIEGDVYDFVEGREPQIQKLIGYFPQEEKAIRKYMKLMTSVATCAPWYFGERTMPNFLSKTVGRFLRYRFERYAKFTTLEILEKLTANKKLISVLATQCGNYGLAPYKSSFGIHAIVAEHYMNGGSYPVGGARNIQKTILEEFKLRGGTLALQAEVKSLIYENGSVKGVELVNGKKLFSPVVISNAGVRNTFERLMPVNWSIPEVIKKTLSKIKPSASHVCLYLGLDGSDEALALPKNNIWIYDDYDFSRLDDEGHGNPLAEKGLTYISFPSSKDPQWKEKNRDKATVQVIAPCSYQQVKKWENFPQGDRGQDYVEFKAKITEKLTSKLLSVLPQIKGRITFSELSTPLSTKHFANYSTGEIYGLEHTPERFTYSFLRPETAVKGLYLTGQDIVTVGVGGALYSGVLAATKVLNKSVIMRILFNRAL